MSQARTIGLSSIALGASVMSCFAIVFFTCRNFFPTFYVSDLNVISIAAHLLIIAGLFQISDGAHSNTLDISIQGTSVVGHRDIPAVRVFRVVAGYGSQSDGSILHRARNRADLVHGP